MMEGQAGSWYSAVPAWFAQDICQCPTVLCYKGGNFLPACSGELQCSALACVVVWIYFRGFVFVLFENGQGAPEQSGLNVG